MLIKIIKFQYRTYQWYTSSHFLNHSISIFTSRSVLSCKIAQTKKKINLAFASVFSIEPLNCFLSLICRWMEIKKNSHNLSHVPTVHYLMNIYHLQHNIHINYRQFIALPCESKSEFRSVCICGVHSTSLT